MNSTPPTISSKDEQKSKEEFHNLVDRYVDHYNCNQIESSLYSCFNELDKKFFFKRRKYNQCLKIQKEFQHCLIYSNENKFVKREPYYTINSKNEIYEKYSEAKLENKKDAYDFVSGKKTEEDILNKENKNAKKNLIEL